MINQSGHIVCTAIKTHMYNGMISNSLKSRVCLSKKETKVSVDTGYLGITSLHPNTDIPKKKSKLHPLTIEDKIINKAKASLRIAVEHVNARIKTFKILGEKVS